MRELRPDDIVAILPTKDSPATDVLQIATVQYVGNAIIALADGRMYSKRYGHSMGTSSDGYIVPITDGHRAAMKNKRK
jgi:hypothetical protein